MIRRDFRAAIDWVQDRLVNASNWVENPRWQSTDISSRPGHRMRELFNVSFSVPLTSEDAGDYADEIQPNLPWADDHFEERIGGRPLNPGEQWKNWPWANRADSFRTEGDGQFSHTYMERYWPKYANSDETVPRDGIRYPYGDLSDMIEHLYRHPDTRQAFLPIWFPEDTGVMHGERVPCTLGYHFLYRGGYLHQTYYIRSCDFTRHFRDDLYLSLKLQMYILDQLRGQSDDWRDPQPGFFVFHCVSMHCFENDWYALVKKTEDQRS